MIISFGFNTSGLVSNNKTFSESHLVDLSQVNWFKHRFKTVFLGGFYVCIVFNYKAYYPYKNYTRSFLTFIFTNLVVQQLNHFKLRALKFILFCMLFSAISIAQEHPPINVFSPEDYGAETQNWSISQSKEKYIY